MNEDEFREILSVNLLPMLSGSTLGQSVSSTKRHSAVAYETPCRLLMKPEDSSRFRVRVERSQAFTPEEKKLAGLFGKEFQNIASGPRSPYFDDMMNALPRRVIAGLLAQKTGQTTLRQAISQFESFASQTYEGHPVVATLGITGSLGHGPIRLGDLWKEDFSRVLSNGFDSMYVCGSDGRVFNMEYLPAGPANLLAPFRLAAIAKWCDKKKNRVALVLNRNGEILVFKNEALQFAKRRGNWCHYTHHAVISRLGQGLKKRLRHAVYESCVDVSFARTGGCIAVLTATNVEHLFKVVGESDVVKDEQTTRTKLLNGVVKKRFDLLDRRLRQELLAMDGATVLNHKGELLAAGAIVKLPGGSSSGGRRAAAVQLSKYGLGIKISADGPITAFRNKRVEFSM